MNVRIGKNQEIFKENGEVSFSASDKLTSLVYEILRDVAPSGAVEGKLRQVEEESIDGEITYTNGWLAKYAKHLADRIRKL
jgi:hypothetical protein